MRLFLYLLGLLPLVSTQTHAYPHMYGSAAQLVTQGALIYADEHDDRLPDSIDGIPDIESLIDRRIPRQDIFYLAPQGATTALPSDTPIVWVAMRDQHMAAVGFLGGNVQYFERRQIPYPEGVLYGTNLLLVVSGGLNIFLVLLFLIRRSTRMKGTPNK